ncbi:mucin-13-like [Carcharodon carcharias]|uniref:mucin-13-like n=1 Tax=Carcharodon carcharias TaxID=13397 RepID=UPI001B7E5DF5|nr:mucin-13-like [Carcharodon carcharias]
MSSTITQLKRVKISLETDMTNSETKMKDKDKVMLQTEKEDRNKIRKCKTFGGKLVYARTFEAALNDKQSIEYHDLQEKVHSFFNSSFVNITGYKTTLILEVRKGSVIITVTNTFTESANVTDEKLEEAINITLKANSEFSYIPVPRCKKTECDNKTTTYCFQAPTGAGAECACKTGFYKTDKYATTCKDSCYSNCIGKNRHPVQLDNGECNCGCLAGYEEKNGQCESCPFGYSGTDCKDGFQLIALVIGVIGGVLVLSVTIGLIHTCLRLKHVKSDEHDKLLESDMHTKRPDPIKIPRPNMGTNQTERHWAEWSEMDNYSSGYQNIAMDFSNDKGRRH